MRLLPQHRTAFAVLGILLVAAAATYWFLVRPLRAAINDNRQQVAKKEKRLQRTGQPLDSQLLEREISRLQAELDGTGGKPGLVSTTQRVLDTATSMFADRVKERYGSPELFRRDADRVFFQSDFSRISLKLGKRGAPLAPTVLGISDESPSPYIYQLILQIWTVERLADLADEAGLKIAPVDDVEVTFQGHKTKGADIRLPELRAYFLNESDALPYLLEIPIQTTVVGKLDQVKSFLRQLTANGNFLPASHVEIKADDPARAVYHKGRQVTVTGVRATVQCSSFFQLGSSGAATTAPGKLPGGA
jgi:hypothetical protein